MKALQKAPRPMNKAELSSYLGLLGYYMKFLLNAATFLHLNVCYLGSLKLLPVSQNYPYLG